MGSGAKIFKMLREQRNVSFGGFGDECQLIIFCGISQESERCFHEKKKKKKKEERTF